MATISQYKAYIIPQVCKMEAQTIYGKYAQATAYTDFVEESAKHQIQNFCDDFISEGTNPRLMPDVHAGSGCTVGFTCKVNEYLVPNLIGGDIGCGVLCCKIPFVIRDEQEFFAQLDLYIRKSIPSGFHSYQKCNYSQQELKALYEHTKSHDTMDAKRYFEQLAQLCDKVKSSALTSLGTLGGGNHFIEVDADEQGSLYLVIHTGSRNLGLQTVKYHNQLTQIRKYNFDDVYTQLTELPKIDIEQSVSADFKQYLVAKLQAEHKESQISKMLAKIQTYKRRSDLAFLVGERREAYIADMKTAQSFAQMNRHGIKMRIFEFIKQYAKEHDLEPADAEDVESIHNYIDFDMNIIRKGAISAAAGETVIIPLNMKDGSIIGVGKGNPEWNYSAPHGSGRKMSRTQAKQSLALTSFKEEMKNVYSTSVSAETLDEAPDAYKNSDTIMEYLRDTVEIKRRLCSKYNFKAGVDERDRE